MIKIFKFLLPVFVFINTYAQDGEPDYSLGKVGKKIHGVYIFILSEPHYKYDYIATIKVNINWTGTLGESFEKAIKKAKKKYPYFNGMIFQRSDLSQVDLIKFKGLDVSRGGFHVGDKVSFISFGKLHYGEVVELESTKNRAAVKYINLNNLEDIKNVFYGNLTPINSEEYDDKVKELQENRIKTGLNIGDKAIYKNFEGEQIPCEIIDKELTNNTEKAKIKYITIFEEEKIKTVNVAKLTRTSKEDYNEKLNVLKTDIQKYKYTVGEKVSILVGIGINQKQYEGEIVALDDTYHKASVKYIDSNGSEKIKKVSYLKLTKLIK